MVMFVQWQQRNNNLHVVRELRENLKDVIRKVEHSFSAQVVTQKCTNAHLALNQKRKSQFTAHLALRRPRFFPAKLSAE
jgi:hypothetical protein